MKKVYDVCVAKQNHKGEFVKNKDGKSIYKNIGYIFEDDKGYKKLLLETMNGDVWATLFESKAKDDNGVVGVEDDIPF